MLALSRRLVVLAMQVLLLVVLNLFPPVLEHEVRLVA
jgi:hypothetical protein